MLEIQIEMKYREIIVLQNLMLSIKIPQTVGRFNEGECQDHLGREIYNNCQLEDFMTLLVTDMAPFCNERDMICTLFVGKVMNSEYAI